VAAGTYPVTLLTAAPAGGGPGDVAAAMVRFAPGDPVRWEMAVVEGQDPATLEPGAIFGYSVDSGTGAFTSAEARAALDDADAFEAYMTSVLAALEPSGDVAVLSADIPIDPGSGANAIVFPSGLGDGYFASYFGVDAAGTPIVLLTDFALIDVPSEAHPGS
jgi:hypothetical protein